MTVISSRLGYFVDAGRKKICESNFNIDEMENQRVQKKVKNAQAKTEIIVFRKQMLQAANTGLFNPIVAKAHNCECQNLLFPLQINQVKVD